MNRLPQHREPRRDQLVRGHYVQRRQRADADDVTLGVDVSATGESADVDHRFGLEDAEPHPVQKLRAPGEDSSMRLSRSFYRVLVRTRTLVGERLHWTTSAAALMASTICG